MKFILNLLLIFAITFGIAYWYFDFQNPVVLQTEPAINEIDGKINDTKIVSAVENIKTVNETTVIDRIVNYQMCGHQTTEMAGGREEYIGKTYDQLMAEGWQLAQIGNNKIEITTDQYSLCPTCNEKRVFLQSDRGISVYAGTVTHQGDLLMELPVDIQLLPDFFQEALNSGGYEVENHKALNQILESLDECLSIN